MPTACWPAFCPGPSAALCRTKFASSTSPNSKSAARPAIALRRRCGGFIGPRSFRPIFCITCEPAGQLDDYALASRLSYFFWNSLPDERLMQLAGSGKLREPKILRGRGRAPAAGSEIAAARRRFPRPVAEAAADRRDRSGQEAVSRVQPLFAGFDGRRNAGLFPRAAREEPRRARTSSAPTSPC